MAEPDINWNAVHSATQKLIAECEKMKRRNGSGCTTEELIEALNNTRAYLENGKRKT